MCSAVSWPTIAGPPQERHRVAPYLPSTPGLATLTQFDRRILAAALHLDTDLVAVPCVEAPTLPEYLRQAVLPDAAHRIQQELEAGILYASSKALNDLHNFPPVSLCRPAHFFRAAHPAHDGLRLTIEPAALGPLLTELLPYDIDGEVHGIVGLRTVIHRRKVELYLVDHPTARVSLIGLTRPDIAAGLAFTAEVYRAEPHRLVGQAFPDRLSPAEVRDLECFDRVYGPVHLSSGLLRRIRVLGDALWISNWTNGCDTLQVEWPVGVLTRLRVAAKLTCPITGLPGDRTIVDFAGDQPLGLRQPDSPRCPRHPRCGPSELVFRSYPTPSPAGDVRLQAHKRSAHPGWTAWRARMSPHL